MKKQQYQYQKQQEQDQYLNQPQPYQSYFNKAMKIKNKTYPQPLCAKNAKYNKILQLQQLKFLEYYMLPEKDQFDYVYRPGDDSFFMLNVLKSQFKEWIEQWGTFQHKNQNNNLININDKSFSECIIAQIGSGSGIISAHVSSWLKQINQSPMIHLSIDINPDASIMSQKYYSHYNLPIDQITTSLFQNTVISQSKNHYLQKQDNECSNIFKSLKPQVIFFNPPYIPVQLQQIQNQHKYLVSKLKYIRQNKKCIRERQQNMIAYSYMGGEDGLKITIKLLKSIFWSSWVYVIVMGQQGFQKIKEEIQRKENVKQGQQQKKNNFWEKYQGKFKITGQIQLMQYMKYQNQDLFLLKIKIQSNFNQQ